MARSNYIYVVEQVNNTYDPSFDIMATFTVKHECESFLLRTCFERPIHVTRYRDNPRDLEDSRGVELKFNPTEGFVK